jgi:hypothetical protein
MQGVRVAATTPKGQLNLQRSRCIRACKRVNETMMDDGNLFRMIIYSECTSECARAHRRPEQAPGKFAVVPAGGRDSSGSFPTG